MLQMCMDQNFFLYGMIAAGILGVWCLFWSSRFYHTAVKDMRRRDEPKGRWTEEVMELADRRGAGMRDTEDTRSRVVSRREGSWGSGWKAC